MFQYQNEQIKFRRIFPEAVNIIVIYPIFVKA